MGMNPALIVDDEPEMRAIIQATLKQIELGAVESSSSQNASELIDKEK